MLLPLQPKNSVNLSKNYVTVGNFRLATFVCLNNTVNIKGFSMSRM